MFEDANLFIGLDDASPETRLDTVEKLRASVRQGGGELPVHNLTQLFQLMSDRLKDEDNRVALMSAELLCDLLNRDLLTTDIYFPIVLPAMFQNLANDRRRDSSVYVLTTYVEAMGGADCILEGMVQHGLMHDKAKVREQTLLTLATIVEGYLVPSASAGRDDYMKLLAELTYRLNDNDQKVVEAAGLALAFAKSEDKNFTKHVGALGQATLDSVTAVLSSHAKVQNDNNNQFNTKKTNTIISPNTISSSTISSSNINTVASSETKRSLQSEFESKDTMLMLNQEEDIAMAAVAKLDQLDTTLLNNNNNNNNSNNLNVEGSYDSGDVKNNSPLSNNTASTSNIISTTSPSSSIGSIETSNLFSNEQQLEIDRIRAGKDQQDYVESAAAAVAAAAALVADLDIEETKAVEMKSPSTIKNASSSTTLTTPTKNNNETKTTIQVSQPKSSPASVRMDFTSNVTDEVNNLQKEREAYSERNQDGKFGKMESVFFEKKIISIQLIKILLLYLFSL